MSLRFICLNFQERKSRVHNYTVKSKDSSVREGTHANETQGRKPSASDSSLAKEHSCIDLYKLFCSAAATYISFIGCQYH